MDRNEVFAASNAYFDSKFPGFTVSGSQNWNFWYGYKEGRDVYEMFEETYNKLRSLSNYPFKWYENGSSVEESLKYAKENKLWNICKYCSVPYLKSAGFKTACCEEHYILRRKNGYKKLSASRLLYNNQDPVQYAKRHNISVEEAEKIVKKTKREASNRCIEYWLSRGYTEEYGREQISIIQSVSSPRTIEYWLAKGLSADEAEKARFEYQSASGKRSKEKYGCCKRFSSWCIEFWLDRGYTEDEAKAKVSQNSRDASLFYVDNVPADIRRQSNWMCKEYYIKRFGDNWEAEYTKAFENRGSYTFRSKISDEFLTKLNDKFSWLDSNRYFGEREFTTYSIDAGRAFKYDYVDTKLKIVVEFNGDYWHANPNVYKPNDVIQYPNDLYMRAEEVWLRDAAKIKLMLDRGYKCYTVWELDVKDNMDEVLNNLYGEILNENY